MGNQKQIYVIASADGYCKVGHAHDAKRRVAALQTSTPHELSLIYQSPRTLSKAEALGAELRISEYWWDDYVRGEWFRITPARIAEFVRIVDLIATDKYDDLYDETVANNG